MGDIFWLQSSFNPGDLDSESRMLDLAYHITASPWEMLNAISISSSYLFIYLFILFILFIIIIIIKILFCFILFIYWLIDWIFINGFFDNLPNRTPVRFSYNAYKAENSLDWLVVWVLWHINPCRLFNTISIFMQIVSSISNNSVKNGYTVQFQKHFYFKRFSLFKQF